MATSAQHATYAANSGYSASAVRTHDHFAQFDVSPSDLVGGPVRRGRARKILWSLALLGLLGGGGWSAIEYPAVWSSGLASASSLVQSLWDYQTKPALAPTKPQETALSAPPLEPLKTPIASAPSAEAPTKPMTDRLPAATAPSAPAKVEEAAKADEQAAAPAAAPQVRASAVPAASTSYEAPASAQRAAPGDPFLKKAETAGLHPDLSRVILARLSDTDFRNAGVAIQKAVTDVADDAEYLWPRQRKAGEAQFKVHFVAGAAAENCRRYVVTIAKDGWLTTALPMEKCGVKVPLRRAATERAAKSSDAP